MNKKTKDIILCSVVAVAIVGIIVAIVVFSNGKKDYDTVSDTTAATTVAPTTNNSVDVPFDADNYVKRAYELKYIFSVESFNKLSDISVNKAVQYAFCHIYNDSLVDMPANTKMAYKSATEKQIKDMLKTQFGSNDIDVTLSDLYNKKSKVFEMWQPNYSRAVTYSVSGGKKGSNYQLNVTYYEDQSRSTQIGTATITVAEKNKSFYFSSMS